MAKIFCIEDEADILDALVEVLTDEGHEVTQARDGKAGLEALLRAKPDIIICDIFMPGLDGYQVFRELHEQRPNYVDVPFVFLSALPLDQTKLLKDKVVVDRYLTKPVDFDELIEVVNSLTKSYD